MAEPILVTPGQSVGQGDWEALFAQHGGFKSSQQRPPTKDEQRAADDANDDLEQRPIYRYYLADGSWVEARTAANGADYQIVAYQPSQRFQQSRAASQRADTTGPPGGAPYRDDGPEAGPSGRRWGWNPETKAYDRDLGPSPSAQRPTTGSKRVPLPGHPGYSTVTTVDSATNREETHVEKDDNPGVAVPAPADVPKDTPTTVTRNGKTYVQHTTPGADGKPGRIFWTDQAGNEVQLPDDTSAGNTPIPPGVPVYAPDFDDPAGDLGLSAYDRALRKAHEAGLVDRKTAADLMAAAGNTAQVADARERGRRSDETTRRQQDLGETQSRRNAANSAYSTAFNDYSSFAGKLPVGSGAIAADAFQAALRMQQRNAEDWGGLPSYEDTAAYTQALGGPGAVPVQAAPAAPPAQAGGTVPGAVTVTVHPSGPAPAVAPAAAPAPAAAAPTAPQGQQPPDFTDPATGGFGMPGGGPRTAQPQGQAQPSPRWDPSGTVAQLKRDGYTDDEIGEVLTGMGHAA